MPVRTPSAAQLGYLKRLGCKQVHGGVRGSAPMGCGGRADRSVRRPLQVPKDGLEASQLIEKFKQGK